MLPTHVHDPYNRFQHVFACIMIGFVEQLWQPHNGATSKYTWSFVSAPCWSIIWIEDHIQDFERFKISEQNLVCRCFPVPQGNETLVLKSLHAIVFENVGYLTWNMWTPYHLWLSQWYCSNSVPSTVPTIRTCKLLVLKQHGSTPPRIHNLISARGYVVHLTARPLYAR